MQRDDLPVLITRIISYCSVSVGFLSALGLLVTDNKRQEIMMLKMKKSARATKSSVMVVKWLFEIIKERLQKSPLNKGVVITRKGQKRL